MDIISKGLKQIDPESLNGIMAYDAYLLLVADLLAENKSTGETQSGSLTGYSKLNLHRMRRIYKTINILPEVKATVEKIAIPQTWFVLTESWCGDAAQTLPVFAACSALNSNIELKILLRDDNLSLMDQFLTNGSKSIPKLISLNAATGKELFNWGPRPEELQKKFLQMKKDGIAYDTIKEDLQRWYTQDRTYSTQKEVALLISYALQNPV